MKKFAITCAVLLAIALTTPVNAQDKLKNDPTYSTSNYKHPNKAAEAARWEPEASIEFRPRKRRPAMNIASYREQQRLGGMRESAIAVPAGPSVANRNYKQQNRLVSPAPAKAEVATKIQPEESTGGN
ncbi:hypothetical protein [Larkinella soli]|uniref:hypothetical protein n=1 Tax=Larkinella soli TaxID=1770527 RepID=UPI000FFB1316|nr:hypothetical protein [Larkinella soli]